MPTYRNDTAARITWGSGWIDPGQTKISPDHWPYTELGLTLVSALPLVATPIKHSQRVALAAPSAAVAASAILTAATGKTLTFTAGFIDHPSFAAANAVLAVQGEGLAVAIEANSADTLAVSNPTGTNVILVKLASTTASKNTDELIQAAVRDLETVDGINVADMTVTGNEAYDGAPVIGHDVGTAAGVVLDFGDSKTLTISSVYPGSWYNDLAFAVQQADDDTLVLSYASGVIEIDLAIDTAGNNSAAAIEALLQALTVEGYDMTAFTVVESAEFAAARPTAVKAVQVVNFADAEETSLGVLTLTAGIGGSIGNFISEISWGVNDSDALACSYDTETELVNVLLANATPSKNAAAALQTALRAVTGSPFGAALSLMTVVADATWIASPPVAFVTNGNVVEGSTAGADITPIAETPLTGGDEEVVAETDFDNAADGTTISTVALNSFGKAALSLVVLTGEVEAKLGDSTLGIPLSTSVDYQGVHQYKKVDKVVLTSIAAAEVLVTVEEAE